MKLNEVKQNIGKEVFLKDASIAYFNDEIGSVSKTDMKNLSNKDLRAVSKNKMVVTGKSPAGNVRVDLIDQNGEVIDFMYIHHNCLSTKVETQQQSKINDIFDFNTNNLQEGSKIISSEGRIVYTVISSFVPCFETPCSQYLNSNLCFLVESSDEGIFSQPIQWLNAIINVNKDMYVLP